MCCPATSHNHRQRHHPSVYRGKSICEGVAEGLWQAKAIDCGWIRWGCGHPPSCLLDSRLWRTVQCRPQQTASQQARAVWATMAWSTAAWHRGARPSTTIAHNTVVNRRNSPRTIIHNSMPLSSVLSESEDVHHTSQRAWRYRRVTQIEMSPARPSSLHLSVSSCAHTHVRTPARTHYMFKCAKLQACTWSNCCGTHWIQ